MKGISLAQALRYMGVERGFQTAPAPGFYRCRGEDDGDVHAGTSLD